MATKPTTQTHIAELLDEQSLEVIQDIAPNDGMYKYGPELYPEAGQTALRCVRLALLAADQEDPARILDFASGAGRVLRYLKAAFPAAELTACDVTESQVEFCARVFGATGVVSTPDPDQIELDGPYDLIWCGSLLTHVGSKLWVKFLKVMDSVLAPGGLMVFTVYGRAIVDLLRTRMNTLGLTDDQADGLVRSYDEEGFGFQVVQGRPEEDFGDCVASRAWVCTQLERETPDLQHLMYLERTWLEQDVIACMKRP